jgi:predicted nucleotidyltransferase
MKRLDLIPLKDNELRAIEAAAKVLRERLPVEQVILFGSKARGEDDPESDIDLLVLTKRPLTRDEQRLVIDLLFPIELEHDVVFSTLEITAAEWVHGLYQVLPLRAEVERDGVAA